MPTDILGHHYETGDLVAIAMANAGPHNEPNMIFAVVEDIITTDDQGQPLMRSQRSLTRDADGRSVIIEKQLPHFIVKARPHASSSIDFIGELGPQARLRSYSKPENIFAVPGIALSEILEYPAL